jgi:outer membrane receptor for ferrienterochelin and colicins
MRQLQFLLIMTMGVIAIHVSAQTLTTGKGITDSTHEIGEVVITSTGTQHLLKDTPVQTEVISRKMLERYGGKSLEDILSGLTASFAFAQGDMGSQTQLNGLGNNYILILIDGKRIHGDVGGENDLGLIDPHNIERIEIVKGAQSALYGSDAMAGVINIITKKHTEKGIYADNTTRYGTHNDLRQHNTLTLNIGQFSSQTNFQFQRNDGWQNTAEEWAEGMVLADSRNMTVNKFRNWQLAERLTYQPTPNLQLYAEGSYYKKIFSVRQTGVIPVVMFIPTTCATIMLLHQLAGRCI